MFNQIKKSSAIYKYAIHRETIGNLDNFKPRRHGTQYDTLGRAGPTVLKWQGPCRLRPGRHVDVPEAMKKSLMFF